MGVARKYVPTWCASRPDHSILERHHLDAVQLRTQWRISPGMAARYFGRNRSRVNTRRGARPRAPVAALLFSGTPQGNRQNPHVVLGAPCVVATRVGHGTGAHAARNSQHDHHGHTLIARIPPRRRHRRRGRLRWPGLVVVAVAAKLR